MIKEKEEYDISIACVDGTDNGSDGSYWGQFLQARDKYKDWNDHVVGKDSGQRKGPLPDKGKLIIKIYDLPPLETCPERYDSNGNLVKGFAMTPEGTTKRPNVVNHYYESISD
jgi:hypothetical protein